MANDKNLIPMNKRSKSEARRLGSKGGVKSGKTRKKNANLRKAFGVILSSEVTDEDLKKMLEEMGFEKTNEMALAIVFIRKALAGDIRALEQIIKLMGNKDDEDLKEQKARTKQMASSIENEKLRLELEKYKTYGNTDEDGKDENIKSFLAAISTHNTNLYGDFDENKYKENDINGETEEETRK